MTDAALTVDGVSVAYRRPDGSRATVVSQVSLRLEPAAVVGLVGESGCGKSSLALACLGATAEGGAITVMHAGEIVESGATRDVVRNPRHPYTQALLAALPRPPQHGATGGSVAEPEPVHILELDGVWCQYRQQTQPAVSGVSLVIARGDTVGVVGESGSGKSTLLRAIAGLHPPHRGTIRFRGHDLAPAARQRPPEVRRDIQLVFQNPDSSLNPRQSVGEILTRPIRLFRSDVTRRAEARAVAAALDQVRLAAGTAQRYPGELSGGQRQRVAIARAFAARPALLLCDEVTSALDVSIQATVLELITELATTCATSVVFVSHDLAVVRTICRRAVVLRAGRICEDGSADAVFAAPDHPYTQELIAAIPALPTQVPNDVAK